jgi:ubiquinone/menaquinone biosynthesis C-methylase UbiE
MIQRIAIIPSLLLISSLPLLLFGDSQSAGVQTGQETNVRPGINQRWKSDNITPLIDLLESADRDIYAHRVELAKIANPSTGSTVADVGAGSGFMVEEFSKMVGAKGKVYAVDINLKLLEQIEQRAKQRGLNNIQTILATDDSSRLAPNSIDLVFICDTYHHFEYPRSTLRSIFEALKPSGQLVLVEFKRIPGKSPDWIMDHIRAGREVFVQEISDAGFSYIQEHEAQFIPRNYVLRFRKP